MTLTNQQIARILKVDDPRNVSEYWPRISQCLADLLKDQYSDKVRFAALATIRVECPAFAPMREIGGVKYLNDKYDCRTNLGNTPECDGDGALYRGRGFIQITGKSNYVKYGKLLALDMVRNPDIALEPDVAAVIFAAYFVNEGCADAANRFNWVKVRKIVNGGRNKLQEFLEWIDKLAAEAQIPEITATVASDLRKVKNA